MKWQIPLKKLYNMEKDYMNPHDWDKEAWNDIAHSATLIPLMITLVYAIIVIFA